MSRIPTPATIEAAPVKARPLLEAVHRQLGVVPNLLADAAVRFAAKVASLRGHVSGADLQAVRMAGCEDAQVVEIVQHAALNTWTNYINEVARTEIDFPAVEAAAA